MPDRFDDLPVLAGLGVSLRAAMAQAEAADPAPAPSAVARPEQHARRWRRATSGRFGALSTVLVLGLVGTAAAAATLTILRGSPIPAPRSADLQRTMTVRPGTAKVLELRAADPSGQNLPFALRTATSASGLTCVTVGQLDGDDFGLVGTDRRFRELPETVVDSCGSPAPGEVAVAGARVLQAKRYADVRSVVYGLGGRELQTVDLVARGQRRAVPVREGAFLAVIPGYPEDSALKLELGFANGTTTDYPLGQADGNVLDPSGPAYILFPMGIGTMTGNYSCVDLRPARPTTRGNHPATPPACTADDPRNDTPRVQRISARAPWYFDIRTFQPGARSAEGREGLITGSWRWPAPEARTVVWGSAKPRIVKRVVARAGGVEVGRARPQRPSGVFAIVLPASIPATAVEVELELRSGGSRTARGPTNLKELRR